MDCSQLTHGLLFIFNKLVLCSCIVYSYIENCTVKVYLNYYVILSQFYIWKQIRTCWRKLCSPKILLVYNFGNVERPSCAESVLISCENNIHMWIKGNYLYLIPVYSTILPNHVALVGVVLCKFPCRNIFVRFYQLWVLSLDEWPKIRRKNLCMVTLIEQPSQRLHSLQRWHIKHNGSIYLVLKIHFPGKALFAYVYWGRSSNLGFVTILKAVTQKGHDIKGLYFLKACNSQTY